jgi:hypothetical protein
MDEKQKIILEDLQRQRDSVIAEINNLENQIKAKKDYFYKIMGGIETIGLLNSEQSIQEEVSVE